MPQEKPRILYVEDDETLSFVTKDNLEDHGYEIIHSKDGQEALEQFGKWKFDLCVLDIMLPKLDGFHIAEEIRRKNQDVPIIFLTAKSMKEDKIHGLKLGADDYIIKPYSIEELRLKIEIFLKRCRKTGDSKGEQIFSIGIYVFDYQNLSLVNGKEKAQLTQREADLLKYFCSHLNQVVNREDILKEIWGSNDYFLGRSLDVFISRLRKYLQNDSRIKLQNIHGVGFKMEIGKQQPL